MILKPAHKTTVSDRRKGRHRSVDEQVVPHLVKGRAAERLVGDYLERLGLGPVELGNGLGPDLICDPLGKRIKVEVKSTIKQSVGNSWLVHTVSPGRQSDDWIAIVLPNNYIVIEPMALHLQRCQPNGRRTVTDLVEAFGGVA